MKKLVYAALLGVIVLLTACSGGVSSSLPKNEYLGDLPIIIDTYNKSDSILRTEAEERLNKVTSEKDLPKLEKYVKEYKEKEDAIEKKRDDAIAKTKEKLMGTQVPVANEDPRYAVSELTITDVDKSGVYLTGKLKTAEVVKKTGGLFSITFETRDAEDNAISKKGMIVVDNEDYKVKEIPAETEYTFSLSVSISKPSSAKFAKVAFIPQQ